MLMGEDTNRSCPLTHYFTTCRHAPSSIQMYKILSPGELMLIRD